MFITFTKLLLFSVISFTCIGETWKEVNSVDDITVFVKKRKSGVIPIKSISLINAPVDMVLEVLLDYDNKSSWAPRLKSVKLHKKISNNEFIVSEYYKSPWPLSDREFLIKGRLDRYSDKEYTLSGTSIVNDNLKNNNYIQAVVMKLDVNIKEVSTGLTLMTFEFLVDMRGWVPAWMVGIAQRIWPIKFTQRLRRVIANKSQNKLNLK